MSTSYTFKYMKTDGMFDSPKLIKEVCLKVEKNNRLYFTYNHKLDCSYIKEMCSRIKSSIANGDTEIKIPDELGVMKVLNFTIVDKLKLDFKDSKSVSGGLKEKVYKNLTYEYDNKPSILFIPDNF